MKTSAMLFVLVSGVPPATMHAAAKTENQQAIVVSVETHGAQSNSNYAGPLDHCSHKFTPMTSAYGWVLPSTEQVMLPLSTIFRQSSPPTAQSRSILEITRCM
jgi:hypothetical protein